MTDNQVVQAVLNKGTSKWPRLMLEYREIFKLLCQFDVRLQVKYLHTSLNVRADYLSRLAPHSEWEVSDQLFGQLVTRFGLPDVDRFASVATAKLPSFNSLVRGPGSLGDAMSVSWSGVLNYVNPPFNMIRDVVKKVLMDRAESILVPPYWLNQPWWPILLPHVTEMRIVIKFTL